MTGREQRFIEHYLTCWNASEAARWAGYSERSARELGRRLMKRSSVQTAINARIAEQTARADEVLIRLSEQARFDAGEFISDDGRLDIEGAYRRGLGKFVKHIKRRGDTVEIEFISTQRALYLLGKMLGLFTNRAELSGASRAREKY